MVASFCASASRLICFLFVCFSESFSPLLVATGIRSECYKHGRNYWARQIAEQDTLHRTPLVQFGRHVLARRSQPLFHQAASRASRRASAPRNQGRYSDCAGCKHSSFPHNNGISSSCVLPINTWRFGASFSAFRKFDLRLCHAVKRLAGRRVGVVDFDETGRGCRNCGIGHPRASRRGGAL